MTTIEKVLASRYFNVAIAIFSGSLYPLAFAPLAWRPLAWLSLGVLIALWYRASSPRQAFIQGYLWGLAAFLVGVSWVFCSMYDYGGAPIFAAASFTFLFVAYLSCYPAFVGWAWCYRYRHRRGSWWSICFLACLWSISEWLRSWLFTGFPWLLLGFAQLDTPLAGYLPVMGAMSLSALVVAGIAVIVVAFVYRAHSRKIATAFMLGVLALGGGLSSVSWEQDLSDIDIALVQGNISQEYKLRPEYLGVSLQAYRELSQSHWDADLVVWPETAIPSYPEQVRDYLNELEALLADVPAALYTGIFLPTEDQQSYYNAMLEIGGQRQTYEKYRLVPFGEYMPVQWLMAIFARFVYIPQSDLRAGVLPAAPVSLAGTKVATSICYDMAYPDVLRAQLPAAQLMVNASNDAWFGHSLAPHQHLEIARVRAKELARSLIRVTNTGLTAVIDYRGNIVDQVPQFATAVLRTVAQTNAATTPFMSMGQFNMMCLITALWILAAIRGRALTRVLNLGKTAL